MTVQVDYLTMPLKELVLHIQRGSNFYNDLEGTIPTLTSSCFIKPNFKPSGIMRTSEENLKHCQVHQLKRAQADEVLIPIAGAAGWAMVTPKRYIGTLLTNHIVAIKADSNVLLPWYLALALNSRDVQTQTDQWRYMDVIPMIDMRVFDHIHFPLPSLVTQKKMYEAYKKRRSKVFHTQFEEMIKELGLEE